MRLFCYFRVVGMKVVFVVGWGVGFVYVYVCGGLFWWYYWVRC